jgi:hypothetical protein
MLCRTRKLIFARTPADLKSSAGISLSKPEFQILGWFTKNGYDQVNNFLVQNQPTFVQK